MILRSLALLLLTTTAAYGGGFLVDHQTKPVDSITLVGAPAVLHVHALNLTTRPTDWLEQTYAWDFGDPGSQTTVDPRTGQPIDLNTSLQGPVAAYLYDKPGTYTVTLTRTAADGSTTTYQTKVIVPPPNRTVIYVAPDGNDADVGTDPAAPIKSAAAAIGRLADHTEVRFKRGGTYPLSVQFPVKKFDLVVDDYGDGPLPVVYRLNPPTTTQPGTKSDINFIFDTWTTQTDTVTIRRLRFDSPWNPALTAGGLAYHMPVSSFGILRGRDVTVADCEFVNLFEGPKGDHGVTGMLCLRDRQVDPLGMPSRTVWLEGTDVVVIGVTALNSINESPFRSCESGVIRGLVAFNDIAQQLDAGHGRPLAKAAATFRAMADVELIGNRVTDGEFSFDPQTADTYDDRMRIERNVVAGSFVHIKANVRHAVFCDNLVTTPGDVGGCFTVTAGYSSMYVQDIQIRHNSGTGPAGRMYAVDGHGDGAVREMNFDLTSNTWCKAR